MNPPRLFFARRRARQPRRPRCRSGFSLAELLLALLVLNVAVLALVMGGTFVVRETSELRVRGAAIEAATNRLSVLTAGSCTATSGDSASVQGIVESWNAALLANRVLDVADSVSYTARGVPRAVVLRTRVPC